MNPVRNSQIHFDKYKILDHFSFFTVINTLDSLGVRNF